MDSEAREGESRQPQIEVEPTLQLSLEHPREDTPAMIPLFQEVGLPVKVTTYLAAVGDLPEGDYSKWADAYEKLEREFKRQGFLSPDEERMVADAALILAENLIMASVTYQNVPNSSAIRKLVKEIPPETKPMVEIGTSDAYPPTFRPVDTLPITEGLMEELTERYVDQALREISRGREYFSIDGSHYWAITDTPEEDTWVKAKLIDGVPEEAREKMRHEMIKHSGTYPPSILLYYSPIPEAERRRIAQLLPFKDVRQEFLDRWYEVDEQSDDFKRLASEITPHVRVRVERLADEGYIHAGVSWETLWENKLRVSVSSRGDVGKDNRIKEDVPSDPTDRVSIRIMPALKPDGAPYSFDEYAEAGRGLKDALLSP